MELMLPTALADESDIAIIVPEDEPSTVSVVQEDEFDESDVAPETLTPQFSPDSFKANITKVSIGAPITGVDGRKYLPVTATFTANENIGNSDLVHFLEGIVKAVLANGATAEGVTGLGLTLMGPLKPDVPLDNNMYSWEWKSDGGGGTGTGTLKYNIPLLDSGETQSVETSQATGQEEVNGLKEGDKVTLQVETVIANVPEEMSLVRGDEFTFTVENASKYPKEITKSEEPEPQEPKNVAIAKMVTSDGKVSASQTVSWPKSQASIAFRPSKLEGYNVSPAEHLFTKDGEVFTFTYTPTESTAAVADVTVTVNYTVPAGYAAPASKKATGAPRANYQIDTPEVKGLFPSQRTVAGQFGEKNQTFTVSYSGMAMVDDRVVAVPTGSVYTYNGHFQEGVPAHVGYKPAGGSINHARLPGVYQVMLTLNAGYRWTDGSTDPKVVTWAINPAPLSSMVLDRSRFDVEQDPTQKPNIVAVIANGIVVPQGAYNVTYSDPTAEQPGIYSVTVTAIDSNFTGKLTETYGKTQMVMIACPHHGEKVNYMSNGDGATHDEECAYCNKVLVGRDHQACTFDKVGGKVVDNIDPLNPNSGKPTGQVFLVCSKCNQGKPDFETCQHEGTRAFRDNGDGNHTEYCTRCGLDLFVEEHEMVDEAVKTPVGNGQGQKAVAYQGTYAHKCSKCSYRELKQCPHEKTHAERIGGGDFKDHYIYCDLCKAAVDRVPCSNFERRCMNATQHSKYCAECGSIHGYFGHAWQRQITRVDAIPRACKSSSWLNPNKLLFTYYDYRIHYTETCKQCKAKRIGAYLYKTNDNNGSFNYKKAFQDLIKMNPDELANAYSIWEGGGSYLLPVANYLIDPLLSTLQPATSLVGWDSVEYASLDFMQLVGWEGSTESPGDGYSLYGPDGKLIESAKVPGDVPNPAWSVESSSGAQTQGLQAQEVLPEPVDGADSVPDLGGATEAYVAIKGSVLAGLEDGPHTLVVGGLLENGERVCSVIEFTIETVNSGNGPQKMIKDPHPLGASVDQEGDVVSMRLSTDTVAYTGEAVELPTVTVAKTRENAEAEGGVENVPLDPSAYKLTYYRIKDVEGNEPVQVEVDPAAIADVGSYCVVATPTEGAAWSGSAFANFRVARTFESANAAMTLEFDHAAFTGVQIEPAVTVRAFVNGGEQTLTQSYAYESTDAEESGETVTTLTQGGAGDYVVEYKDNVEEGTATVTVTGVGLWTGELSATFAIEAAPAPENSLTELELTETVLAYNGADQKPAVACVKAGDVEVDPADYSVEFPDGESVLPGTYQIKVSAEPGGAFVGSLVATYRIDGQAADPSLTITSLELKTTSAVYTGAAHNPVKAVKAGEMTLGAGDYTVAYKDAGGKVVASIKDAGTYTVTVTGKGNFEGTKSATYQVTKAANPVAVTAKDPAALTFKTSAQKIACPVGVSKAQGKVSYAKASGAKYVTVDASSGKVTLAAKTPAGSYTVGIKVTAQGNANYQSKSVTKTFAIKVNKAANPVKIKAKTCSVKYNQTKKCIIAASKAFSVTKARGKVTFKKADGDAKVKISKKGVVTVAKGTKKGKHKIKVRITVAGNANYASKTIKNVVLTVKVK